MLDVDVGGQFKYLQPFAPEKLTLYRQPHTSSDCSRIVRTLLDHVEKASITVLLLTAHTWRWDERDYHH